MLVAPVGASVIRLSASVLELHRHAHEVVGVWLAVVSRSGRVNGGDRQWYIDSRLMMSRVVTLG